MTTSILKIIRKISAQQLFMISVLLVNGGNYLYNLVLGRILGPKAFAEAAVLITLLLVISFVAMTFQLATAKFITTIKNKNKFISKMLKNGILAGIFFGFLMIYFADEIQNLLKTSSSIIFIIFGFGIPIYFAMSVNRGVLQGESSFKKLSVTYQSEMLSRLLFTFLLLWIFDVNSSILISIGILISFFFGLIPINIKELNLFKKVTFSKTESKKITAFFAITAFYELSQIIINNSDILLAKHYFTDLDAGLYASLALIGRVVYFIAWMFVMLLLPAVIQLKKNNKPTAPLLFKYIFYIGSISLFIILNCAIFPEFIINSLFGSDYLIIAPLLWKYALATGIFAISNIFAYYFLSLDNYIPVIFSALFGLLQILGIIIYHSTILEVINVQIVVMIALFISQILFFINTENKDKKRKSKSNYISTKANCI